MKVCWIFGGKGWLNESMSDKGDYRTALSTMSLLTTSDHNDMTSDPCCQFNLHNWPQNIIKKNIVSNLAVKA